MQDSAPEIIKFKNGSHYHYFRFVMEALDTIFFYEDENPPLVDPATVTYFDWLTHEQLVYKFPADPPDDEGYTALTLQQFLLLISIIDKIGKIMHGVGSDGAG